MSKKSRNGQWQARHVVKPPDEKAMQVHMMALALVGDWVQFLGSLSMWAKPNAEITAEEFRLLRLGTDRELDELTGFTREFLKRLWAEKRRELKEMGNGKAGADSGGN